MSSARVRTWHVFEPLIRSTPNSAWTDLSSVTFVSDHCTTASDGIPCTTLPGLRLISMPVIRCWWDEQFEKRYASTKSDMRTPYTSIDMLRIKWTKPLFCIKKLRTVFVDSEKSYDRVPKEILRWRTPVRKYLPKVCFSKTCTKERASTRVKRVYCAETDLVLVSELWTRNLFPSVTDGITSDAQDEVPVDGGCSRAGKWASGGSRQRQVWKVDTRR